jgi:hypothetical protein
MMKTWCFQLKFFARETAVTTKRECYQDPVIEREIDEVRSSLKESEIRTAVSREWQSEGRNVRVPLESVGALLLAPHDEESMLPS